jgi:2'-hydroxyisoflavone reductase
VPEETVAASPLRSSSSANPKRILVLGGTGFIGPPEVRYARERGHSLTLFNRGVTNPSLFPDVEHLRGDRAGNLDALKGREWDVVIDNHATLPEWVRDAAELLKDHVGQYVFISTLSAYKRPLDVGADERAAIYTPEDLAAARAAGDEPYGPNKAQAEREAEGQLPGRTTIVRPGLIVGPDDPSDRFTYWPVRMDRGGEVLAPGDGSLPVQVIDVRDLTRFIVDLAEHGVVGVYNATGPRKPYMMIEFLHGIRAVTASEVSLTWVPVDFLLDQGVQPWSELPIWRSQGSESVLAVNVDRAHAAGLRVRPLADTARDTLEWWRTLPPERTGAPVAGLSPERERQVLAAWHASPAGSEE